MLFNVFKWFVKPTYIYVVFGPFVNLAVYLEKSFSPKIHILIVLKLKLYFILSNIVVEALDIYSVLFVLDINKRNASSL